MRLEVQIFNALSSVVPGRSYALSLPISPVTPVVPALKYQFISSEINADICGDGGDDLANTRTQVDVFANNHNSARALRLQVIAAMTTIATPTIWDGGGDNYDNDLKLFVCSLDFVSYPSS